MGDCTIAVNKGGISDSKLKGGRGILPGKAARPRTIYYKSEVVFQAPTERLVCFLAHRKAIEGRPYGRVGFMCGILTRAVFCPPPPPFYGGYILTENWSSMIKSFISPRLSPSLYLDPTIGRRIFKVQ